MAQTNDLLLKVEIHKVKLDRLRNIGVLVRLMCAGCMCEGFTLGLDQVYTKSKPDLKQA